MASKFKKKIISMALAICMAASPIATLPMNVFAGSGSNNGGTTKKAFGVVSLAKNNTIDNIYTLDNSKQPFKFGDGDVLDASKKVVNPGIVYAKDETDNVEVAEKTYIIADVDGMLNDLKDAFPYTAKFTDAQINNNDNYTVNYTVSNCYVNSVSIDNNTGTVTLKDSDNSTMSVTLNGVATVTGANSDTIQNTGNVIINIQDKTFTFQNGDESSFSCPISNNGTMGWSDLYWHWFDIPNITFTISFNPLVSEGFRSQVDEACAAEATLEQKLKALHAGYSALATAWEDQGNEAMKTKCSDRASALKEVIDNCYENKVGDIEQQAG